MRLSVVILASLMTRVVSAQPDIDPASAEPPGSGLPPPAPPPNSGPPALMPLPLYTMTDHGFEFHHGLTFEANIGVFGARIGGDQLGGAAFTKTGGLAGIDVGLGGFILPRVALTFRIAGGEISNQGDLILVSFAGPSTQIWLDPHIWIGAGVGASVLGYLSSCNAANVACNLGGVGLDLRAGYSFVGSRNTINVSVEATPALYSEPSDGGPATPSSSVGFALLFGYQYL